MSINLSTPDSAVNKATYRKVHLRFRTGSLLSMALKDLWRLYRFESLHCMTTVTIPSCKAGSRRRSRCRRIAAGCDFLLFSGSIALLFSDHRIEGRLLQEWQLLC